MRFTFKPDDCMVINIPLKSIKNEAEGQLMPEKFICRFKDNYKVFQSGHPKALGVAQISTAVFILCLGGILLTCCDFTFYICSLPSLLYLIIGGLAISAAHTPLMPMMKVSFVFNILGLFLAIAMTSYMCFLLCSKPLTHYQLYNSNGFYQNRDVYVGVNVLMMMLYMFEFLLSVILIHWESKAMCRAHFNSLPIITLTQDM